jgi:hypothetical protein
MSDWLPKLKTALAIGVPAALIAAYLWLRFREDEEQATSNAAQSPATAQTAVPSAKATTDAAPTTATTASAASPSCNSTAELTLNVMQMLFTSIIVSNEPLACKSHAKKPKIC